jgi:amino acid transporter
MVTMAKPAGMLEGASGQGGRQRATQPDPFWYTAKTKLLGPPLVNEQLSEQRLSKPLALGVLSPDGISSSAYGTEEILIALLPMAGLAAFTLILPMTLVILLVMTFVVMSYREVVMVYIKPGGSYVVARENFGPRIAQVCAVALLIDYVVTVAVQVAAGTAAVASVVPAIGPYEVEICVGVVLLMCFGNLRGIKEAGKAFAVPTYLFAGSVLLMIAVGLVREVIGNLHTVHTTAGTYTIGSGSEGILTAVMIYTLLKAFANGGASLTGIEAVSDAVGAFNPPEGRNARQVLVTEGVILGLLVAGIGWLAHVVHATPYLVGYPTVLSQEANVVFGSAGHFMFFVVQFATMLILYTGANTSFNGFPFLTSYVAGDSFLPRWLLKRGHRLVFSNAIILLTVTSVILLIIKKADVNSLVPLYAIGVFTAFTMAGFGMAKYHHTHREQGWRHKFTINFAAGALSLIVVLIFAVVKFTEGAWVVLVLFVVLVPALIRLNAEYRAETEVLDTVTGAQPPPPPHYSRRVVFVFVDSFDLATLAALRYARSLRPTQIRAVHFVIDSVRAEILRDKWTRADRGVALDFIDCPDRRLTKAATDLAEREIEDPGTHVTVILPRRSYSALLGRLLHDRTADKIAAAVSRIPRSAATIVPYDVPSRVAVLQARHAAAKAGKADKPAMASAGPTTGLPAADPAVADRAVADPAATDLAAIDLATGKLAKAEQELARESDVVAAHSVPAQPGTRTTAGVAAIGTVTGGKVRVEGKIRVVEIRPVERNSVLAVEINDSTGNLTALFYGRSHIPGLICGARVRFTGPARIRGGQPVMINPAYELVSHGEDDSHS